MSLPVVLRLPAYDDLDAIHTTYEGLRPGLGTDFVAEVGAVPSRIGQHPTLYGVIGRGVRAAPVRRFPYLVYYLVEPSRVVIIAILHVRRSPRLAAAHLAGVRHSAWPHRSSWSTPSG